MSRERLIVHPAWFINHAEQWHAELGYPNAQATIDAVNAIPDEGGDFHGFHMVRKVGFLAMPILAINWLEDDATIGVHVGEFIPPDPEDLAPPPAYCIALGARTIDEIPPIKD